MKLKIFYFLLSAIILYGCSKDDRVQEDKFVKIYSDLLIAGDTTSIAKAKKKVLKKYNITGIQYENTLNYYNSNPELWAPFFEKVIAHIESQKPKPSS